MSDKNDKRFNFAISQKLLDEIEEFRKSFDKTPPTAEAIRHLLKYALANIPAPREPRQ